MTLKRLIAGGADIDAKDQHGQTALMIAARVGHTQAVRCLLECRPDLNHTAKYHLSALMLAVLNRRVEVVRALVEAGADLEIRGTGAPGFHDKTALDLATGQKRHDLVEMLQSTTNTNRQT
jgi:ankyrin repeat protein